MRGKDDGMLCKVGLGSSCTFILRAVRKICGPGDFEERPATIYDNKIIIRQKYICQHTPLASLFFKHHVYVVANPC